MSDQLIVDIRFEIEGTVKQSFEDTFERIRHLKDDVTFDQFMNGVVVAAIDQSIAVIGELAGAEDDQASLYTGLIADDDREALETIIARLKCDPQMLMAGVEIDPETIVACALATGLRLIVENDEVFDHLRNWLLDGDDA